MSWLPHDGTNGKIQKQSKETAITLNLEITQKGNKRYFPVLRNKRKTHKHDQLTEKSGPKRGGGKRENHSTYIMLRIVMSSYFLSSARRGKGIRSFIVLPL